VLVAVAAFTQLTASTVVSIAAGAPLPSEQTPPSESSAGAAIPPDESTAEPSGERAAEAPKTYGEVLAAYHAALARRRLGSHEALGLPDVRARLAEAEALLFEGRTDEATAKLAALVEHPRFASFAEDEEGRAAVFRLGDALATAGVHEPARAYLKRLVASRGAWSGTAPYARRSVRRIAEMALEARRYEQGLEDLQAMPANAPPEVRGERSYLLGRAKEERGETDAALAAYAEVPKTSRFWAQATYLQGLILVEKGRFKEGEDLFCKVADPKRQSRTTPVLADQRFFAVRDLARLALGRVAHEQSRFDDSRYYYYLVPRDSERLAEALYEAATSRYEKKDYDGARELLDELAAIGQHHRYEDEAKVLDAYVDLALCRFDTADQKLRAFLARYEPVRDASRRVQGDPRAMQRLLLAARTGGDAGAGEGSSVASPEAMRAMAALVRVDPAYGDVVRRRAVLEREASGLKAAAAALADMQTSLQTNGGVRPALVVQAGDVDPSERVNAALDATRRNIAELRAAGASAERLAPLEAELAVLEDRARSVTRPVEAGRSAADAQAGDADLPDLLRRDATNAGALGARIGAARSALAAEEERLARDALARLDLRLSRLLRRARLGRIESVLGRKRALEVEIEAISEGFLPAGAVDSLDAARYLKDNEEYWPFEGDDWPDEFVGGEGLR
jgi:hypothetical protein